MRIAQVAPLYESVPPRYYGGTERVVWALTEELVRLGHDVTLYASADSLTSARLVSGPPQALRLVASHDALAHHVLQLEQLMREIQLYDVVHFHTEHIQYLMARRMTTPSVTTLHGRLDSQDLVPLFREFAEMPVVSISNAQREPLPWLNWLGTILHGLPASEFRLHEQPGGYLAFMGRISPEKRVDRAIRIAQRVGMPLRIAAKIDPFDGDYFESLAPLFADPLVDFLGEIGQSQKNDFLGNASALLFPIDWPEPFGLVMIEAMACGTPVIAYRDGSVPEVIDDGVTGFVVDDLDAAVEAVGRLGDLSRARVRQVFESRFSAERMAHDYLAVYEQLVRESDDGAIPGASVIRSVADSTHESPARAGAPGHPDA
ncbi:MAG: glycosyltransferase family 4 protein [Chloroflexota bacterium]|nr:glycosyltransferase family 4 protein [Chloroflexota bacterium]